jgi:DNA-binding winged helix-turn-helix (wHTH) protein/Tol biopolymer transport system component
MGFPARFRFGVFEVDLQSGELRKQGVKLKLQDQPFQILAALLERPGEIVTREDLRQRLGASDAFGDFDHLVNKAVNKIREVLGDSADSPRFVETLPRRGYRFLATVESIDPREPRPSAPQSGTTTPANRRRRRETLAWTCAGTAFLVAAGLAITHSHEKPAELNPVQFQIPLPPRMAPEWMPMLSPDGRQIVWRGIVEGKARLWRRSMEAPAISSLAGTDDAIWPFWSPDSRFIGFFAGGKLKKLELSTGTIRDLCEVANGALGTWNADGVIVFGKFERPLLRISAVGGKPAVVREIDLRSGEMCAAFPSFLPDGRHYTYWSFRQDNKIFRYLASLDSKDARLLIPDANETFYSPPGFMIFRSGNSTLVAQPFDLVHLQLRGTPIRVADHVAYFSVSQTGVLAYVSTPESTQLAWYTRDGKRLSTVGERAYYNEIMLSPDGGRLLFERTATGDDWLLDLASGVASRMTWHTAHDGVWSPDGQEFIFSSDQKGRKVLDLYRKVVGGGEQLLFASAVDKYPQDWSRDGSFIVFMTPSSNGGTALYRLPLAGERKPELLLENGSDINEARLSLDGRWIAYDSNQSGRWETYVAAFPGFTQQRQVSSAGGGQALWRNDGKELFYLSLDGKIMAVDVKTGSTIETGVPHMLFQTKISVDPELDLFCVTHDGQRFLVSEPAAESPAITVVVNWPAMLRR